MNIKINNFKQSQKLNQQTNANFKKKNKLGQKINRNSWSAKMIQLLFKTKQQDSEPLLNLR